MKQVKNYISIPLAEYLQTDSGKAVLELLEKSRPKIYKSSTGFEKQALEAARASGWEDCLAFLKNLSEYREKSNPNEPYIEN